ncbi:MAG: hypothetical protein ABIQ58_01995 [Candidatus Limnocylindrales bacterium]
MHFDLMLAYIDPGSGSLIIQAVIATVIAVPFFFRTQIARVLKMVRRGDEQVADVKPNDPAS